MGSVCGCGGSGWVGAASIVCVLPSNVRMDVGGGEEVISLGWWGETSLRNQTQGLLHMTTILAFPKM